MSADELHYDNGVILAHKRGAPKRSYGDFLVVQL